MAAMLEMKKIEIDELERAAAEGIVTPCSTTGLWSV